MLLLDYFMGNSGQVGGQMLDSKRVAYEASRPSPEHL